MNWIGAPFRKNASGHLRIRILETSNTLNRCPACVQMIFSARVMAYVTVCETQLRTRRTLIRRHIGSFNTVSDEISKMCVCSTNKRDCCNVNKCRIAMQRYKVWLIIYKVKVRILKGIFYRMIIDLYIYKWNVYDIIIMLFKCYYLFIDIPIFDL